MKLTIDKRNERIEKIMACFAQGMKQKDVAKEIGVSQGAFSQFLARHGIARRQTGRPVGVCAKPDVLARIKPLIEQGMMPTEVANRTGIRVDTIRHYARRYCKRAYLKVRNHACASNARRQWGTETADPAILTHEQLDTARRVGITPERFAWLCSIPKNIDRKGGAIGHRGGNTIG